MPEAANLGITSEVLQKEFNKNAALLTQSKQMFDANSKIQTGMQLNRTTELYGENVAELKARQLSLVPTVSASSDGSGSLNVVNANDNKSISIKQGDEITAATTALSREETAIAAFITNMQ